MESRNHIKNGAKPKSHKSRQKYIEQINMRKDLFIMVLFLVLMGCNQPKNNWIKAKKTNSIAEVKKYLTENAGSEFENEAINFKDSLELAKAKQANSIAEIKKFLEANSRSSYDIEAKNVLDSLEWVKVKLSDSIDEVNTFIRNYPKSKHIQEANKILINLDWAKAKGYNTSESYKEFLNNHPSNEFTSLAKTKIKDLGHQIEFKGVNITFQMVYSSKGSFNNSIPAFVSKGFDYALLTDENTVFKNIKIVKGNVRYIIDNNATYNVRGRTARRGEFEIEIKWGQQIIVASYVEYIGK